METRGNRSIADVAEGLGVLTNQLYDWRHKFGDVRQTVREELKRLRRDVATCPLRLGPKRTTPLLTTSTTSTTAVEGDSANSREGGPIVGLSLSGKFDDVHVSIVAQGTVLADYEFQPEYQGEELNGEGCGVCGTAEAEIPIDAAD